MAKKKRQGKKKDDLEHISLGSLPDRRAMEQIMRQFLGGLGDEGCGHGARNTPPAALVGPRNAAFPVESRGFGTKRLTWLSPGCQAVNPMTSPLPPD
jgi:hypothetical protein